MKKQYSKRKTRASRRKYARSKKRTQRRQRQRQRQRTHKRHGGSMPPIPLSAPSGDLIQQNISTITFSIVNAINGVNGRWSRDFYIIDQGTCKMKVSASDNEGNQSAMSNFTQNLPQKMQEINNDLSSRTTPPVAISDLQVLDVTSEEVRAMSQDPRFVSLYYDSVEEDLEDWDSGIHRLIVFSVN